MRFRNSPEGYGMIAMSLHWVIAALVGIAWLLGTFGDDFSKGPARSAALLVHISAGLALLALMVVRSVWRIVDPPPPPEPTKLGHWLDRAGVAAHYGLYLLIFIVVALGIALQFARGDALPIFGWTEISLPFPWAPDRPFARTVKEIHETAANVLMILVCIHTAAALFHHWILRDRTLVRILPGPARRTRPN
jgi:cytochrome b561